ncbi:hypothetical protein MNBD_IGNAVI01-1258 [hydrothermal vent metagenome]|uniref:Uncharacterized protein n=1 Tax=hydrothermal vent metagenome TaxID=652676 RepID=A0A3B1CC40_9ZZZZ
MISRKFKFIITLLLLANATIISGNNGKTVGQKSNEVKIVPGKFIVKFKSTNGYGTQASFSQLSFVAAKYNTKKQKQVFAQAKNVKVKQKLNLNNVFVFETDGSADIQKIVNELNQDPGVEYAEPVYLSKIESEPNDPLYPQQYHFPQISAPAAWDIQASSTDVIIGVIDTGVDWDHEDLADNIWSNSGEIPDNGIDDDGNGYIDDVRGWDFVQGVTGTKDWQSAPDEDGDTTDNNPMDYNGHGTHVAGIAGAVTNNGIGVASASGGAQIMPLRCGYHANDGNGYVPSDFAAEAYVYAADMGANITNQSSGNSGQAVVDAAYYAFLNGVLIVESAGNGDAITPSALGGQDWVISVASVNQLDKKAYYSSYGDYVDVSSPGGELLSGNNTWGHLSTIVYPSNFYGGLKYIKFQGTSMSAPLVASAAALVKSHEPSLSVVDLYTRIVKTADNIDDLNPGYAGLLGSGRINIERALTEVVNATPKFKIISSIIDDAAGNGNGFLDPGEQVQLKIKLRNVWNNASNVNVTLSTDQAWPISIDNANSGIGNITGILDTTSWEAEAVFTISAAADAIPLSNYLQIQISATGYSQTLNYNVAISPQILFIADFEESDNKYFDYSQIYFDAFQNGAISYDYVHHLNTDITSELLSKYNIVVWGCEWTFPSLNADDRTVLKTYLDNGGSLFLSGQDIGWDLNESDDNKDAAFFNNYLKATYIADDAGENEIFGVDDDPITDDLSIDFYQPKRSADQQFPDVIEPRDSAVSILKYADGRSGAVRYTGNYNLVFWGFGGFEAVTDKDIRNTLMKNTTNWLSGIDYSLDNLKDTELTTENFTVEFSAESRSSTINEVILYWDTDGQLPFNKIVMTDLGNGKYSADIPAQSENTDVEYFVFTRSADDHYIISEKHSFHVGADTEAPTLELISKPLVNSVDVYGPYPYGLKLNVDDNLGVDTNSAKIYYTVNDTEPYRSNPMYVEDGILNGSFEFAQPLQIGDKVSYYFEVKDISSNANTTASEVYEYYIDTLQVIDDFEHGLSDWDLEGTWSLSNRRKQGSFSLTDSPDGFYQSNLNMKAVYLMPFNLSPYQYADIDFYLRANLETGKDSLFAEVSNDGGVNWTKELSISQNSVSFTLQKIDLTKYTGPGNEDVRFRFRLFTDAQGERDGIWIDTISIVVSYNDVVGVENEIVQIPKVFSLEQNYPNPFNPSTKINFAIPVESKVKIQVFNILGETVSTLIDQVVQAGNHSLEWNAGSLTSGIYLYRITAESVSGKKNFRSVKKMLLLK